MIHPKPLKGYNTPETLEKFNERFFREYAEFMRKSSVDFYYTYPKAVDLGPRNEKIDYLVHTLGFRCINYPSENFNYFQYSGIQFDVVCCFEIMEHIVNQLSLMEQIAKMLKRDGTLFLSLPGRNSFLWTEHHYHEVTPKRLQDWILTPLGMKIIRKKKIRIGGRPWYFYLSGFRPFLRLFTDHTNIYEIRFNENHA